MASNYPGSLDSFDTIASDKKQSDTVGGRTHRQMHNDLGDAIESVQTELGVNPAGIYDTVAERLAAVDDRVLDGTISDVDINAAADIDRTKIAGTALTTGSTGVFSVLDFGADPTGTYDSTDAINDLIATLDVSPYAGGYVLFPGSAGGNTYRVDGTITIPHRVTVDVQSGATVTRVTAAANTTPIFEITGQHQSRLRGDGMIVTEKASPNGIVHIGPVDIANNAANVLAAQVSGVKIVGVKATGNVGVCLRSSWIAKGGATFQNVVSNVTIQSVGIGVLLSDYANANEFHGVNMLDILDVAYDFYGNGAASDSCCENGVFGGFLHSSTDVLGVKMRKCIYNQVVGLRMEPGGASAVPYTLDASTDSNVLSIISNMTSGGTDAGVNNTIQVNSRTALPELWVGGRKQADTGWRNIASLLINGWTTGTLAIRRVGNVVYLLADALAASGASSQNAVDALPDGFQSLASVATPLAANNDVAQGHVLWSTLASYLFTPTGHATAGNSQINGSWITDDAWPASLPGTAL